MKKFLILFLLFAKIALIGKAQEVNPYSGFGYKVKGKYVMTKEKEGIHLLNKENTAQNLLINPKSKQISVLDSSLNVLKSYGISDRVNTRFLSVDPLQKSFPALTPYQFAGNNPISMIDMDGLEPASINPGTKALVLILQGFGGDPPNNKTQAANAREVGLGPDEALGSINSVGTKLQVVTFASSSTSNTKNDVLSTVKNFRSLNPDGKVVLVGHSGGADNIVEFAKENKDIPINLMITLDVRDPKQTGWTDTNIPSNVKNAINYYQNTDQLNLISDRKMDFSDKTNGVNILSPGSNHRSIDNDQFKNVIRDINNELLNRNPVEKAKERNQPVNNPKKSGSQPIPKTRELINQ